MAPSVHLHDLLDPVHLGGMLERFGQEFAAADPPLAAGWRDYMAGTARSEADVSALLIACAPHVARFVSQLFGVGEAAAHSRRRLLGDDPLVVFRRLYAHKRLRGRQAERLAPLAPGEAAAFARLSQAARRTADGAAAQASPQAWGDAAAQCRPDDANPEDRRRVEISLQLLALHHTLHQRPAPLAEVRAAAAARIATLAALAWGVDAASVQGAGPTPEGLDSRPEEPPEDVADRLLALSDRVHADAMRAGGGASHILYRTPESVDPGGGGRVPTRRDDPDLPERRAAPGPLRQRDGFALTDPRMSSQQVHAEVDYCLKCHPRGRDTCRTGLKSRAGDLLRDAHGTLLSGCPLKERISEAHALRQAGDAIAALAVVCIDNPMCAGTGHRICNDCMKSCIFQKQAPVDVPQVETGILSEVLALPYGFEIYALLARWNPLNRRRPTPRPYGGRNVLVVGLGPAGYTLAHHLANEGIGVVAIDALKLEPLPEALTGLGEAPAQPVESWTALCESLASRPPLGFGGVAEYGITVRWDKNFLKALYLTLVRRPQIRMAGGVRLGSTLTLEEAWAIGFDHIALCAGAGRPTLVPMRNNLLRGMRTASDFLMALQLSGAAQPSALANLQCELPALVIGGGLTAIDSATEMAAYYPLQCERLATMVDSLGEAAVASLSPAERQTAERLLVHGRQVQAARRAGTLDAGALVRAWGGVTVVYRRSLEASPAYRLNPEEVRAALAEGITFAEELTPVAAVADADGHVDGLQLRRRDGGHITLPARAVLIAAGVRPNTIYEREYPGTFALDARGTFFRPHTASLGAEGQVVLSAETERRERISSTASGPATLQVRPAAASGDAASGAFFTSVLHQGRHTVSFFGDNHPHYAGSVVRAMASAKDGYPHIARLLPDRPGAGAQDFARLADSVGRDWRATVRHVRRLGERTVELVVDAPAQARRFQPGQFYRLQNFSSQATRRGGRPLLLESLALTGAEVDSEAGWLSMVALECGVSSRLLSSLKPGEQVVLMGPTGAPTHIPRGEQVVLCGGGLGNAVLMSVGAAMRAAGNHVVLFAAYRQGGDIFKPAAMEAAGDTVVWCVEEGPLPRARRVQDHVFRGRITAAMTALGDLLLRDTDRILTIGSDRMMAAVAAARRGPLAAFLPPHHQALASVNSPMQCMMKELCAQCLQRQVDPVSGEEKFVFSCFNQDQPQDHLDWQHLDARLRQNSVLEKVAGAWLDVALGDDVAHAADIEALFAPGEHDKTGAT